MLNVYNYYVQDYVARTTGQSAHKQRELRDIYKNIVKLSASEPLYKIDLSEQKQACALAIKENSLALRELTSSLAATPLLQTAGLSSDNDRCVTAEFLHRTNLSDFSDDAAYEIKVSSLATGQVNTGYRLNSEDTPLSEGSYSFTVSIGYENYSFRFNVAPDSKTFDLQSKLSDFINKTGIGLKAQFFYDKESSQSCLSIAAEQTGTFGKSTFSIVDSSVPFGVKEGLASVLGIDRVTVPAANTKYEVNGETFETSDFEATYKDLFRLSFHGTTDTPVTVRPVADNAAASKAMDAFVQGYNLLVGAGRDTQNENRSSAHLLSVLSHVVSTNYSMLTASGLSVNSDGFLTRNTAETADTSTMDGTRRLFSGNSTFLNSLNDRLDTMILNPMKYVDKKLVTYPGTEAENARRTSPYTTSIYSGMLFNNYC